MPITILKQEEEGIVTCQHFVKTNMKEKSVSAEKKADCTSEVDEKELEKRAVDEIFREIAIKSVRAKEFGPSGWLDCPLKKTNKRFLSKTLKATVSHNERKTEKQKFSSEKKLLEMDYDKKPSRKPKFGDRKHLFKKKHKEDSH